MFVLALLLVAAAVVISIGVVGASTESVSLEIFMISVPATVATVFLAGAITGFAFLLGLWLLKAGAKQSRKRRHGRRALEQEHRRKMTELEKEKEQLQTRLGDGPPGGQPTTPTDPPKTDPTRTGPA